jgi:hypothetical protein
MKKYLKTDVNKIMETTQVFIPNPSPEALEEGRNGKKRF